MNSAIILIQSSVAGAISFVGLGTVETEARHVMTDKDDFDLWWQWVEKPVDSMLTIDAANHVKPDAAMVPPRKPAKAYRIVQ